MYIILCLEWNMKVILLRYNIVSCIPYPTFDTCINVRSRQAYGICNVLDFSVSPQRYGSGNDRITLL